jgi:tetratricopeptide (TPR) repeat protein
MTWRAATVVALLVLPGVLWWPVARAEGREDSRLAHAASRCTKQAELIACYEALNIKPGNPDLLVAEADALVQLKRPGEAIGVYRNGLSLGANRAAVLARISAASALRQTVLDDCLTRDGAVAERACESAWLPGAPDEVAVFKRRGMLLQSAGRPAAALEAYLAAARLKPKDRDVARSVVALAGETDVKDALTLTAVGTAHVTLGRRSDAVVAFRRALRLSPGLKGAQEGLRGAERAGAVAGATAPLSVATAGTAGGPGSGGATGGFSNQAEVTRSN